MSTLLRRRAMMNQGGGGNPQGMTHIGSGSFTFAGRTSSTEKIYHGLNFTPKFVLLWTDDSAPAYNDIFYVILQNGLPDNYGTRYSHRIICYRSSNGAAINAPTIGSTLDMYVNSEYFYVNHGSYYYKAGATYNWFAFN